MTEGGQQSWSRLMQWRSECHRRFGSVLDLPVASVHDALAGLLGPNLRVLDIGAGAHKPFRNTVKAAHAEYFSMDIDPEGTFDFGSFEDVPPVVKFDLIIANQVLEHLTIDDAFALLNSAGSHMDQGAGLVATAPNAAHPVRQWDCTHITAWPANDLYSLLRSAGLEVTSLARYTKFPLTANPVKRWIVRTVCKEFRIDWCDSIMAVATKS
jgi:hypothetical protein